MYVRKGQGEARSYALNAVARKEVGDEKLDYTEDANIKTLPYVNFKKFVMYNIKDVLLQMGIERKTSDVDNIYQRAYSNATSYSKIFKQTVFLKSRAYVEFYKQGLIIGNNINVEYGVYDDVKKNEEEDEKFDGALVADPVLNDFTGIRLFGTKNKYIFDNVIDEDFSSMYPYIIISFNIAPNTMIGKLIIGGDIQEAFESAKLEAEGKSKVEDPGKDFVDNMLIGNVANMGTKWFNLPGMDKIFEMANERFGSTNKKDITYFKESDLVSPFTEVILDRNEEDMAG